MRLGPARGYYLPETITPDVDSHHHEEMMRLGCQVPQAPEDLLRFMRSFADVVPSYQAVVRGLMPTSIQLGDGLCAHLDENLNVDTMEFPGDLPPLAYIHSLLRQSALFAPAPEGVTLPPIACSQDRSDIKQSLLVRFGWREAVRTSLLLQIDQEMEARKIAFDPSDREWGLLGPTDLAFFRLIRSGGLAAAALAFPHFLSSGEQASIDACVDAMLDNIVSAGVAAAEPWSPPVISPLPELPRTTLDEMADRLQPWERGLFVRDASVALAPARCDEITALLRKKVEQDSDVAEALALIGEIAPQLAEKIFVLQRRGLVKISVEPHEFHVPIRIAPHEEAIFGNPVTQPFSLTVKSGFSMELVITELVRHLARTTVPQEIIDLVSQVPQTDSDRDSENVALFLERIDTRAAVWAMSAQFEFLHQARALGLPFVETPILTARRRVFEECGYFVLCERWRELADPAAMELMLAWFHEMAQQIVDSHRAREPGSGDA